MNELDFSGKQVLVVGGSSGIGNGIAQAFRGKGARVTVCGTRDRAADYSPGEGSDLEGLDYVRLDVSDGKAIEEFKPAFATLDVLVLAQGAVIYRRGEGIAHHRIVDSGLSRDQGQSGLQRLEDRCARADAHAWAGLGGRGHPRQRHRARPGRHQDDQGHDRKSKAAR